MASSSRVRNALLSASTDVVGLFISGCHGSAGQRRTVGLWPTLDRAPGLADGGRFCRKLRQTPRLPPTHGTPLTVGTGPPERLPVGSNAAGSAAAGGANTTTSATTAKTIRPIPAA